MMLLCSGCFKQLKSFVTGFRVVAGSTAGRFLTKIRTRAEVRGRRPNTRNNFVLRYAVCASANQPCPRLGTIRFGRERSEGQKCCNFSGLTSLRTYSGPVKSVKIKMPRWQALLVS